MYAENWMGRVPFLKWWLCKQVIDQTKGVGGGLHPWKAGRFYFLRLVVVASAWQLKAAHHSLCPQKPVHTHAHVWVMNKIHANFCVCAGVT